MADTTLPGLLGVGDHASRPAASAVGSGGLYACTTHNLIYQTDGSSWSTWATLGTAGAVTGPGSSTGGDFVTWNGTGGDTLQDSGVSLDTDGTLAADSDTKIPSQKAVKTYADQLLGAAHALEYKGATDCSANPNYPAGVVGDLYMVSVAGKIGGASGVSVNAGDLFVCVTDNAGGTQAAVGSDWDVIHATATGSVTGPGSATSDDIVTFNGATGAVIQDSGKTFDTDGTLAANSDAKVATQKAVKTYVDSAVGGSLPDPSGEPDGEVLTTSGGAAVWAADPGGSGDALNTVASSGAALTIDYGNGNVQDVTLDADCTFTLTGFTNGDPDFLTLVLRQDGTGGRTVTWPTITWIGTGVEPILQTAASSVDTVVLFSFDGGTTVYGVAQTSASGIAAGTSFPGSPSDGDLFYRTDSRIMYEYDSTATKWLSLDRKYISFYANPNGYTVNTVAISNFVVPEDIYVESMVGITYVSTTNNGSNYWTVTLSKQTLPGVNSAIASFSTSADAANVGVRHTVSVGVVVDAATYGRLFWGIAKTSSPGQVYPDLMFVVRSVG